MCHYHAETEEYQAGADSSVQGGGHDEEEQALQVRRGPAHLHEERPATPGSVFPRGPPAGYGARTPTIHTEIAHTTGATLPV